MESLANSYSSESQRAHFVISMGNLDLFFIISYLEILAPKFSCSMTRPE